VAVVTEINSWQCDDTMDSTFVGALLINLLRVVRYFAVVGVV
jgi:hypothetical protein